MASKSNAFRARTTTMIAFLILIGLVEGATFAPACAAQTPGARKVTIVNGTRTAMVALQAKEFRAEAWPADVLNHRTLGIQKQIVLELPANSTCFYDVRAMFEDGHRVMKKHVDLCKSPVYLLTDF